MSTVLLLVGTIAGGLLIGWYALSRKAPTPEQAREAWTWFAIRFVPIAVVAVVGAKVVLQ